MATKQTPVVSEAEPAVFEPLTERVDWLARELELAIRWGRPSILLAVYSSTYVANEAAWTLEAKLREAGQAVEWVGVTSEADADVPLRLADHPRRDKTVFFVSGLQWGGKKALRTLNIRREYFADQRLRAVFWLTENEAVAIAREAPDFWAFRHRVVEFVEPPEPGQVVEVARELAWRGFEDRTLREDTEAKIALREALLADLPEGDETLAARAELLFTLGGLYWADRQYERAEESLRAALEGARRTANVRLETWCHNGLGVVYADLGHHEEAIAEYQRAIELDPQYAFPHNGLGTVYEDLGHHEEAIAEYQRAAELDPQRAYPHNNLGNIYRDLGRYEEAIAECQQAIKLDPQDAYPHNNLGNVYYDLGRYEEAIAKYQRAIELDPQHAYLHKNLGDGYRVLGRHDEAIAEYQRAIEFDPQFAYAYDNMAEIFSQRGEYERARDLYQKSLELQPRLKPHIGLARVYRHLGQEEKFREHIEQARALSPDEYNLACLESISGNVDAAIKHLRAALEKAPGKRDWARRDPDFDFIRNDPRFQELVNEGADAGGQEGEG
jgi:tetratricopeptide (TPR) repeat protein